MVVLPPGGNGMMSVIGRAGKSCADAGMALANTADAEPATNARLPMFGISSSFAVSSPPDLGSFAPFPVTVAHSA